MCPESKDTSRVGR